MGDAGQRLSLSPKTLQNGVMAARKVLRKAIGPQGCSMLDAFITQDALQLRPVIVKGGVNIGLAVLT